MDKETYEKLFDVRGRFAIVAGGTRGIGRAVAEGLVCGGAKVVVGSRKAAACAETETHLRELAAASGSGVDAVAMAAHMGELDAATGLVARAADVFGGVDIVVNNA